MRRAKRPAARQHPRPDARMYGGTISWRPPTWSAGDLFTPCRKHEQLAHGRLSCRPTTKGSPASALRLGEGIPSTLLLGRAIERLAKRNFTRRETFSPISPEMIIVGSSSNETPDANRPCCRRVAYAADVTRGRAAFGADSLFNDITHGHGRHPDQTWWSRPPLRMDPQPRTPLRICSWATSRLVGAQGYPACSHKSKQAHRRPANRLSCAR